MVEAATKHAQQLQVLEAAYQRRLLVCLCTLLTHLPLGLEALHPK